MRGDPRWITAKFKSTCSTCGGRILAGERIFYYPQSRSVMCNKYDCGGKASREFEAMAADESMSG
jgi:hypothetical protein